MPDADEAAAIIPALGLVPHPEGGHYREIYRAHGSGDAARTAPAAR
ncbi:MAG: cupin domain-containing protein [Alphaproteobacteria bacterium]